MLKKYDFDIILTGDNHQTFDIEIDNKILVNPGSVLRMKSNQDKHKPCVFLYQDKLEKIYLPIEKDVFRDVYVMPESLKINRMENLIKKLDKKINITFDFEKNVMNYLSKNRVEKKVKQEIIKAMPTT